MGELREALATGRAALAQLFSSGEMPDPADGETKPLRDMGKWRFVLLRGFLGFGLPMFLWFVLSSLPNDIHLARRIHQPVSSYLLHYWASALGASALMGFVVGLLAWRRVVSDVWPGAEPHSESSITTLGHLGGR